MTTNKNRGLRGALTTATQIKPDEVKTTVAAFSLVFLLMTSYMILKPVRDAMASDWTDTEVSFLWSINFFISAAIVAVYGFAISRIRLRLIVPVVYGFFALSFVAFFLLVASLEDRVLVDKSFYVWVSVFSLFHLSVFWTLMSDTFSKEQAKRLFAVIALGATAGGIVGPFLARILVQPLGVYNLMLLASVLLVCVIPVVFYIVRFKQNADASQSISREMEQAILGGAWWNGFRALFANPYLLFIAFFILLYVFISSFVYFEQKNVLAPFPREERTQILSAIDLVANLLTLFLAFFVTGRLVKRFGMAVSLALMPVVVIAGFATLAFVPVMTVLFAFQVARKCGNYAITRPAREMLYTRVSQEERFKTKPVIDIVVYRGGDALSSYLFAFLTEGIGLGLAAVAWVGAGIAALWAGLAVAIGRRFDRGGTESEPDRSTGEMARES